MELQLVLLEQAKKLKKLGFKWKVDSYYDNEKIHYSIKYNWNEEKDCLSAPTTSLALKWFRDVKGLVYYIKIKFDGSSEPLGWEFQHTIIKSHKIKKGMRQTYEEAESSLLDALIKYMEEKNNGNRK